MPIIRLFHWLSGVKYDETSTREYQEKLNELYKLEVPNSLDGPGAPGYTGKGFILDHSKVF